MAITSACHADNVSSILTTCSIMNKIIELQNELAKEYHYKPLSTELSKRCREAYRINIPEFLKIEGDPDQPLYNISGNLIANGYSRIVIGDYGAFIEFTKEQGIHGAYFIKKGQEYRLDSNKYPNIKYYWLTTNDNSDIKIYFQKKVVTYADYKPEHFYVSVYEVYEKT